MPNKYWGMGSACLAIRAMQVKDTLRFRLIPVRMSTIYKTNNNKCCEGMLPTTKTKTRATIQRILSRNAETLFTIALLTVVKTGNRPIGTSIAEWIKKM